MQPTNNSINARTIVFAVMLFVALPVCAGVYTHRSNPYKAQTASAATTPAVDFSNGSVLLNWIPQTVYTQAVSIINNYFARGGTPISGMSIGSSGISTGQGSYDFTISIKPQNDTHPVSVRINNFNGTLSTLIFIDGNAQSAQASNGINSANPPTNNISDLVTAAGITNVQASELLQGFAKFAPKASNIQAETSGVQTTILNQGTPDQASAINFIVTIDKTNYLAQAQLADLSSIRLILKDAKTSKQIFDSGVLGSSD